MVDGPDVSRKSGLKAAQSRDRRSKSNLGLLSLFMLIVMLTSCLPSLGYFSLNAYRTVTGHRHLPKRLSACHLTPPAYRSAQLDEHGERFASRACTDGRGVSTNTAAGCAPDSCFRKFGSLRAARSTQRYASRRERRPSVSLSNFAHENAITSGRRSSKCKAEGRLSPQHHTQ